MAKGGFKLNSAMVVLNQQRQALAKRKSRDHEVDEGIVADVDEEEEEEDGEEGESSSSDTETSTDETRHQAKATSRLSKKKARYSAAQRFMDPGEVHAALTLMFEKERELFNLVYDARPRSATQPPVTADMFFIQCLLVPPSRYRPESHTGDGEIAEAQQNELYKSVMRQCASIHEIHREIKMRQTGDGVDEPGKRQRDVSDIRDVWIRLQEAVNSLLDRDRNPIQGAAARQTQDGIKQLLERKEGLFRKNMMGKRVNFAARSVISPDPNIETNEVGVPLVFARKLTYPEPVTSHNFYELKNAVLNGAMKWPGAMAIENENGQVVSLRNKNFEERQALANQLLAPSSNNVVGARNKKVHRHLNNGDIVLMNRQPTLHKPSIMGHRARVLPGEKTIRMHYANCNTYNADFDGDEMNMHFPQNEIARAEALQVADTDHQYLVATSGKPLRGLIQDHLSMGVWLSNKDTFFDKHHYQQLLYSCLRPEDNHTTSDRILTVPPAIIRPRPLWTGKQVVSTLLENIRPVAHPGLTLTSKSSTPGDRWHPESEEGTVLFKDGELLCGILDKSQLGPTVGGMVHSVYEVYGHVVAGKLLGIVGRLLTKLLHMRAFSCGVEDLILRRDGDAARREKLRSAKVIGLEVAARYVTMEDQNVKDDNEELRSRLEDVFRSEEKRVGLDSVVNSRTQVLSSEITRECLPAGLAKQFPQNQMQTMTTSGAKGSIVNANLISCNLGQQILEGRRVPTMISGKTLPSFKPFDTDVRAGGYITDRFLTGIRPQEYYFHCMAGREGLIDTAVKTSRSGYLQRCLVKGLEGLKVEYDNSVRDTDGSVVQFLYGEDGLDITKQKHLMDFKFIAENFFSLFEQLNVREDFQHMLRGGAREWRKKSMKAVRRTGRIDAMDPVLAHFSPSRYMHSTSETFADALAEYQKSNPDKILQDSKKGIAGLVKKKNFEVLMDLKYLKAIIEPGEAVGIVAGQSIGEPSTQMTLNTFHLAGHAAKNVTLGIPRLREIVMTASTKISTPVMTLYLRPELTEQDREQFAKAISRLSLAEIIENVTVNERIGSGTSYASARIYDIRIDFYPADEYCHEYALSTRDVGSALEQKLAPRLQKVIRAELKRRGANRMWTGATTYEALPEVGESAGRIEEAAPSRRNVEGDEEGGDEDDGDDDDDDDVANAKANRANEVTYDDGDDGDDDDDDDDRTAVRDPETISSDVDMTDEGIGSSPEPEGDEDDMDGTPAKELTRTRSDRVKALCKDIEHFRFDEEGQCCEIRVEVSGRPSRYRYGESDSKLEAAVPGGDAKDPGAEPGRGVLSFGGPPRHSGHQELHRQCGEEAGRKEQRRGGGSGRADGRRQHHGDARAPGEAGSEPDHDERHRRHAAALRRRGVPGQHHARDGQRVQGARHRRRPATPEPHRRRDDARRRIPSVQPHRAERQHEPVPEDELRDDDGVSARRRARGRSRRPRQSQRALGPRQDWAGRHGGF